ncbi:MAG: cytochrome c peroxidase [bacterium]
MRLLTAAIVGTLSATLLAGCSHSPETAPSGTTAAPPNPAATVETAAVTDPAGFNTEAFGVYWLDRDTTSPLTAHLTLSRNAAAQGDLYSLPLRPFMTASSLQLLSSTAGPDNSTDYQLRFTHPFAMPADLDRPATSTKRVDLFLFDVNVLLVVPGSDTFFGTAIRTNADALRSADGYRMVGPLADLAALGITDGTNVFPYQLLTNADHASAPAGNYDPIAGWAGPELLNPAGYDVLPQGGSATTTARVNNALTGPLAVVVTGKYQDPRTGTTSFQKRQNRLPDPADATLCRYFLPEACGDLQQVTVNVAGDQFENSSSDITTLTASVLDWDNSATKAGSFPNQANLNQVSELSNPTQIAASIPALWSAGTFNGTLGAPAGLINEYATLTVSINNVDQSYSVVNPNGDDLVGLLRVRDAQDLSSPVPVVLDGALVPQSLPPGFELSTRFQRFTIHMNAATNPPDITTISPLGGGPATDVTFSATVTGDTPTSWLWDFGGGATPNTSSDPAPQVTLAAAEGSFNASLTVVNPDGNDTFNFTLIVEANVPVLPPTPFDYNPALPRHYTDLAYPFGGSIAQADNTPLNNGVTNAGATLGRVLFYDKRLSANNTVACASCHQQIHGFADPAQFSTGFEGGHTTRNSMSLANARYYDNGNFFWDERAGSLEEQVLGPIQNSVEMGMDLPTLETKLAATSFYPGLFTSAFGDPAIDSNRISLALAQFVRSMVSYRSKFDTAEETAVGATPPNYQSVLTPQEFLGFQIFTNGGPNPAIGMNCAQCHRTAGQTLGGAPTPPPGPPPGPFASNNGLDLVTQADAGAGDGRFKAPSLRNIEMTAPYMHDGRFTTLNQVVDFYAEDVQPHPQLHNLLRVNDDPQGPPQHFVLTQNEKDALVSFLRTLTDQPLMTDVKYSNPFPAP